MKKPNFEGVEGEIRKEKAEALGRTGDRLERALLELETFRKEIADLAFSSPTPVLNNGEEVPSEMRERLLEYARLREQARLLRHCLIIQREAAGLRRHEDVDRVYAVPPPLTLALLAHREEGR